ncbi:hypothetical protein HMPREF1548_04539 [Clostridium sp. KLE 1755]|nr:hypothetical protein HMPREF1548_04539 [Clostridium sp. KLE 1755]
MAVPQSPVMLRAQRVRYCVLLSGNSSAVRRKGLLKHENQTMEQ